MKRKQKFFKRNVYLITWILLATMFFTACKKNEYSYERTPAAGLMAFNLAPDKNAVGITLSGNNLTPAPLSFTSYTGAYLPVYVGSREVKSFDVNLDTSMATNTQVFADSMYYSLFTMGSNGSYRNVIVKDALDSLTAIPGQAFVRYVNAIPDSTAAPIVTITANGASVVNNTAPFTYVSGFTNIGAGNISIGVSNGGSISATRTITVDEGKIYTILLAGSPASSDSTRTVQIKYILNGSVTP